MHLPRRRTTTPSWARLAIAVVAIAATACSGSGDAQLPEGIEPLPDDEVTAVAATPSAVWGRGRALHALPVSDTATAVVTTTGVYLADGDAITELEVFGRATQVGPGAVSDDGSTLAVATLAPSIIRWYDVAEGLLIGADQLPVGNDVLEMGFLPGSNDLAAVTSSGVATWPAGPLGGVAMPLGEMAAVGTAAFIADGRIAVPVLETNELALLTPAEVERVPLAIAEGATVLQTHSSPDGSTLGVIHGDGADDLERSDRLAIVDSGSFEVLGVVDLGRAVRPTDWAVTDVGVAVTDGTTISFFTHAGGDLGVMQPPTEQPIVEVLGSGDDLISVHRAGAIVDWTSLDELPDDALVDPGGIAVNEITVDPERARVTTVDFHGRIVTWRPGAPDAIVADDRFEAGVATSVSVSSDGGRVAVAATNGRVELLDGDLTPGTVVTVRDAPVHVDSVEFNPTSGAITTGLAERLGELAFDDTVTVWQSDNSTAAFSIGGESEDVAGCAFFYNRVRYTSDGSLMAVTSHDFSVSLVDTATGAVVHRFEPLPSTVLDLAFSADDEHLVATSDTADVIVWNVADRSVVATYEAAPGGYQAIAVVPGDRVMAAADVTGTLSLIDVLSGDVALTFDGESARTTSLAVSADGSLLAAPAGESTIGIWSTDSGAQLATLSGHAAPITDLEFGPDGTWLVSSSSDGTVRRWSITTTA